MSTEDSLRRSYRRLLWAYPRRYRRERGAELLTTLLDAAAPGRRRATAAERRDLIGGGLRARLRPPRTIAARVITGQVALYLALVGAACGLLLSGYPGPPDVDRSVAAAMLAIPLRPHDVPGPVITCDMICPEPVGDDVTAYRRPWDHTDTVRVGFHPARAEVSTVVGRARDRLAAAGWRVGAVRVQSDGVIWFTASDGSLDLDVTGVATAEEAAVTVVAGKARSRGTVVVVLAGSGAGLLGGWMLAAWALHRFRLHRDARRRFVAVLATPHLVFGTMLALPTAWVSLVGVPKAPLVILPDPATTYWPAHLLIAGSALVALVVVALPGPGRPPPTGSRISLT